MKYTSIITALVLSSSSLFAATIDFSIATDTGAATSAGTALGTGFTGYVGTFSGAVGPSSTFADIAPGFSILYEGAFASGDTAGAAGYFLMPATNFTDADGFAGQQLSVWFSDGGVNNAIVTGFGAIPADGSIPNAVSFAVDQSNAAGLTYTLGSYDPNGTNLAGEGGNIVLNNAVPEPSVAILGALGFLGLVRRRR